MGKGAQKANTNFSKTHSKWKRNACLIIIAACLPCLAAHFQKEPAFAYKIQKIPLEDRRILEAFFRILILEEGGAYVLFGDKPMAFTACLNDCEPSICSKQRWNYYSENQKISNGWKTWKKYRSLFPSKNFIFECNPIDDHRYEICLINKRNFLKIAEKNLENFKSILGEKITPISLLNTFQKKRTAVFNLLQKHEALFGILLGFGRNNAWMFHENRIRMGDDPNREGYRFALNLSPKKYPLESAFGEHNHKKCYKFIQLPYFLADSSSEETQMLRKKYLNQRQEIHQRYAHGDFLEVSLRQMAK